MHKWTIAAAAAAIALSGKARAHEFACEKTIDGSVVRVVNTYPSTLQFRIVVTNTHPTDASVALAFRDDFLTALGLKLPPTPFSLDVGQSIELSASVTIRNQAQCGELAGVQACTAGSTNAFQVLYDTGVAECSARLVCMPDDRMGGEN